MTLPVHQEISPAQHIHRARGGAEALYRLLDAVSTNLPAVPEILPRGTVIDDDLGWTPEQAPGWK